MLGKIDEIIDNSVIVNLDIDITEQPNLVNLHVVFEDGDNRVVGEIVNVNKKILKANIVGEIKDKFFSPGSSTKPSFKSKVRLVNMEELELLLGSQSVKQGQTNFGTSNIYKGYKINVPINDFFSNHFAVLGNSGAGKSCTVASIFQKLYTSSPTPPINSTLFFFDAYGEYTNAFGKLHEHNSALDYKVYTTNVYNPETEVLKIPVWLLDVDDFALLLDANNPSQLPIIEKMLKLEEKQIPKDIDYDKVNNIASEAKQKLKDVRPLTLAQASRISGVNPVDISVLSIYLKKEYGKDK